MVLLGRNLSHDCLKGYPQQARHTMHDRKFFARVLGLVVPSQVKDMNLEWPARVEVILDWRGEHE